MTKESFNRALLPAVEQPWTEDVGEDYGLWYPPVDSDECDELPAGERGSIAIELSWDSDVWRVSLLKPVESVGGMDVVEQVGGLSFEEASERVAEWIRSES